MLSRLGRRLRALLFKNTLDRELDAELAYHLERQIEVNVRNGLNPEEARRAALRSFNGLEQAKEYCRDARGVRTLEDLSQDVRYGARMLAKSPGVNLVAIATIAFGISANTVIFSAADATLVRPLSFPNQDRLLMLFERNSDVGLTRGSSSRGDVQELRAHSQTLKEVVGIRNLELTLSGDGTPERHSAYGVSAAFFDALGVEPQIGRTFDPRDDEEGRSQVVVLRHSFWQSRFAGDPLIVGRTLLLNDKPFVVIGVMPKGFEFPYGGGEMWTPLVLQPRVGQELDSHSLRVLGLLKPGETLGRANAELQSISMRRQQEFPDQEAGRTTYAVMLQSEYTRVAKDYVPMLIASAFFVLLIACSNVASLLLARATTRRREMAVRLALGASRGRLIRQLLTESVLLSLLGGLLGCVLARLGLEAIANGIPTNMSKFIPGWSRLGLSSEALIFAVSISVLTGILFGLVPALQATNTGLNQTLKLGGSKGSRGNDGRNVIRHTLVVSELALSLMLLIGAGLCVRSFVGTLSADFGIKPDGVVAMNLELPRDKYAGEELQTGFYSQLLQRVEALPGVTGVGAINLLPLNGKRMSSKFQMQGEPSERGKEKYTQIRIATPGYFDAIGTDLRQGRMFNVRDSSHAQRVVIVNEAFATRYSRDTAVVGRQLWLGNAVDKPLEIVGVVANAMNDEVVDVVEAGVYVPFAQHPTPQMNLVVRAPVEGDQMARAVRAELAALDPHLPLAEVQTMNQIISERRSPQAVMMWLLVIFAVAALLMATIGMYAVMAYVVAQRTHEIGMRMALGAQAADVLKLFLARGLKLTALGLVIGLAGAIVLTRLMENMLYGVTASDPLTFFGVAAILTVFGLFACFLPARRASKVDPIEAIRCE